MSYILNIYTNPATDYIIDPEPVANLVANKSLFQMLPCFLLRSVCRAKPCHRCLGERFCIKTKKSQKTLRLDFERKTRLETHVARGQFLAIYIYPPNPWKGRVGSLRASLASNKKSSPFGLLLRLSGKRDSNSRPQPWQGCALPTELFPQH